ncbi:MAG TPA: DUF4197 domain-containing protein, partial [Geminicoccaceae bacterium]|nr:DUF4197 domain-containing protein [Geminicoccaceae bacterium]
MLRRALQYSTAVDPVQSTLQMVGMAGLADDLETQMNRAAEATMPEGKTLFVGAIQRMTLTDARGILSGPKDSATRYFQSKMSKPLARRMAPIVERELADAGAVQALDAMMGQYNAIPLAPD